MDSAGSDQKLFSPKPALSAEAHVKSMEQYRAMYQQSVDDPVGFWREIADNFYWHKRCDDKSFHSANFNVNDGTIAVEWLKGAETNICYNVLDHQINQHGYGDNVAFYWEGNEPSDSSAITYNQLLAEVCKFANVLVSKGVKIGDRVAIYMPMIPELVVAMLACARLGAVHSIVFSGFSSDSLAERIIDCQAKVLVTADGVFRGKKLIKLKEIADGALHKSAEEGFEVNLCIVVKHAYARMEAELSNGHGTGTPSSPTAKRSQLAVIPWNEAVDCWWHDLMQSAASTFDTVWLDAEAPLFMLYTSGSTGRPKGVLHTVGGYMLWTATTFKYVFDHHEDDVFFCTADIGWITGHSYITYGPMANGATSVMFEGIPTYPDASRYWSIVAKYKVTKFYTAPTAIRALMKFGEGPVKSKDRSSLKVLGTVGEPINPEAWLFYHNIVGDSRCAIVDTWWQTETGGHMITSLPGVTPMKPGSATLPFFGVVPAILDESGHELEGECQGYLCIKHPWPGVMRTLFGNHERYEDVYFRPFPGYYYSGDGCRRDKDGYYWLTGRSDDVLNTSGHRLGTAEIESALVEHPAICEAAVVGFPHSTKGQGIYCFTTLREGHEFTEELGTVLKEQVRRKIGPFATPDIVQNAPGLPKTRSGKIMRRVLRRVAAGDHNIGDVTTLADPTVIDQLFANRATAFE